jgi:heat shock protein HslJ
MLLIRLILIAHASFIPSALAGCGKASQPKDVEVSAEAASKGAGSTLYGRWRITGINGSPLLRYDGAERSEPHLTFTPSGYIGSTGCNSFSGTGLLLGTRWFGEPPIATQQGCAHLAAQERAILSIASSGPKVALQGPAEATLSSATGSLRLRRETVPEPDATPAAPMLLAGTEWEVGSIDGRPVGELNRRDRARLSFDADRWTINAGCSLLKGPWRQSGSAVVMEIVSKPPSACSPTSKAEDASIRAMVAAGPRFVVGPNRELVMGGGDHWLTGRFAHEREGKAATMLIGEWRVTAIGGAAVKAMRQPPSVIFGKSSYAVWDGCNHTEGVSLVVGGQLFTRGSGMSTIANCTKDQKEARVPAIVGSNPRIAKTESGGLVLAAPSGTLRLTRKSTRNFGTREEVGLRRPRNMTLLRPSARLALQSGGRFAVELACGRVEGSWRGGQPGAL